MALNDKQTRFVDEYLIDLNATQAAIRAGYSKRTAGSQAHDLLKNPEIEAAIAARQAERAVRTGITQDRVLQELALLAFSDMRKFAEWGSDGVKLLDSKAMEEADARCVAEVSESTTKDGGSVKFRIHSKVDALKLIGQHLAMFTEKIQHSNADGDFTLEDLLKAYRSAAK